MRFMKIACTLTTTDLTEQSARWRALTQTAREETADGLRVTFAPGSEQELHELVAVENECCRWARWRIEGTTLVVTSTGEGVSVLQGMFH
jgi:hypothetical protein